MNYFAILTSAVGFLVAALLAAPPAPRPRAPGDATPTLPKAAFLKIAGAGVRELVADYYWILTTNQTGGAQTERDYRDIYFYADLVTDLDPKFISVYRTAAVVIPFNLGRETWVNTKESTALVRKGLVTYPEDIQLNSLLSYNLMYYERAYIDAADLMMRVSKMPGAKPYWAQLATRLYAASGEFDTSMALARSLAESATDEETRTFFEKRMKEIKLERILQDIEMKAMQFQRDKGRAPRSVEEMVVYGVLPGMPVDPMGGEIFLDDIGRARSTAVKYRLEVIEDRIKNERDEVVDKPHTETHDDE